MLAKIDSVQVALQVEWRMPADRAEARSLRKQRATKEFVAHAAGGREWYGFHDRGQGDAYAAAMLVGAARPDVIVYWPIGETEAGATHAWICAIKGGMPVVGCDKVLAVDAARQMFTNWATNEFPQARVVGPVAGGRESVPDLLASLRHDERRYKAALRSAKMGKPGAIARRIAMGAAGVCVVAGAAAGLNIYSHARAARAALEAKARAAVAQYVPNPALIAQQRELEARRRQEAARAALESFRQRVDPSEFWAAVNGVRRALPVSEHGFQPQSIECTEQACQVKWQGKGHYTSAADKAFLPNVQAAAGTDLAATSNFPLVLTSAAMPASTDASADDLTFALKTQLVPRLQALQLDASQPALQQLVLKGQPAIAASGPWHLALNGSTALIDATAVIEQISHWPMRLKAIKYQYASGAVELSGEYVWTAHAQEVADAH